MVLDPAAPFPVLPNELVQQILTIYASSSKSSCLDATFIASWTRHLVLPILWEDVTIVTPAQADAIQLVASRYKHLTKSSDVETSDNEGARPKAISPLSFIRRLCISTAIATSDASTGFDASFLSQCNDLRDIALPSKLLPSLSFIPFITPPSPSGHSLSRSTSDLHVTLLSVGKQPRSVLDLLMLYRFSAFLLAAPIPSPSPKTPPSLIFRHITHLQILCVNILSSFLKGTIHGSGSGSVSFFREMKALTHLAVPLPGPEACARVVVEEVELLEMLVCPTFGVDGLDRATNPERIETIKELREQILKSVEGPDGVEMRKEVIYWASVDPFKLEDELMRPTYEREEREDIWTRARREVREAEIAEAEAERETGEKAPVHLVHVDAE